MRTQTAAGVAILFALLVISACSSATPSHASTTRAITMDLSFTCKWWSLAQMEGINPNAPPPKNTEVRLTKWEYSDPVGVPHPDIVDLVVTLNNTGTETLSRLDVVVDGEWKIGPLKDATQANWIDQFRLKAFQGINVPPATAQVLRVPIDLKAKMNTLDVQQKWPYALRGIVTVRLADSEKPLAHGQAELPIRPGD